MKLMDITLKTYIGLDELKSCDRPGVVEMNEICLK